MNFNLSQSSGSVSEPTKPLEKLNKGELVPKEETQVVNFLKKYPNFDGRNTVVAILDTGVDPGAAGLQVTSEGKPKIIDIIDCTGSGDVKISETPVKLTSDNDNNKKYITGLTGRKLYLNPKWKNPTEEYFLGIKAIKELYPGDVESRVSKSRAKKQGEDNASLVEKVKTELAELKNGVSKEESTKDRIKELEAQDEVLNTLMTQFKRENNTMLDVIVFSDGENYRVAVDWDQNGDLSESQALLDYSINREYWKLNYKKFPYELLNINVKIYANGKLISLVSSAGTHATHVAGILASHHPEDISLDGVAPGAQIVSLKIGDTRLGSMETQLGLTRAISAMVQHKCDLANMSYGEASKLPNQGRFIHWLSQEIIRRYNCIFISSAGNEGPALSTAGSPGGTSDDVIGVGAYVNHSMMKTDYSALEYGPEMAYSWSSRGPTTDGDSSVDIYAPGGAITSVPTYILYKTQLMNGTSMSSPNLAGCISLLVSAMKQENLIYTTYRIQHAIKNTAKSFPLRDCHDKVSKTGIIQVEKAWDYLNCFKEEADLDTKPLITITNHNNRRGIYLREKDETQAPFFANVSVAPKFMNENSVVFGEDINVKKYDFQLYLSLSTNDSFIKIPDVIAYNNGGKNFTFKVDPTHLEPGHVYHGEVQGWDSNNFNKGAILKIPVTIIKPIILQTPIFKLDNFKVSPGSILRRFISVPDEATYCEMKITTASSSNNPVRMYAHMVQLVPNERFSEYEHQYMLSFDPNSNENLDMNGTQTEKRTFKVIGGRTIEICLVQFWANVGNQQFSIEFNFHGIKLLPYNNISNNTPLILDSNTNHKLELISTLRNETKVKLNGNLDTLLKYIAPINFKLNTLISERDLLPPNNTRLYQLILEYDFTVTNLQTPVTLQLQYSQSMEKFLYDSFLDGFFVIIYDAFNKPISYDEVSPRNHTLPYLGDYKIKIELNHIDPKILDKLKNDSILGLKFKLPKNKETSLNFYNHPHLDYINGSNTLQRMDLKKKEFNSIYLKSSGFIDNIDAKAGDLLLGSINFAVDNGLSNNEKLSIGMLIPPKINLKDSEEENKAPAYDEVFITEEDKMEFKLIKSQLESIDNSNNSEWKLKQMEKIINSIKENLFKSTAQEEKDQKECQLRYKLEIIHNLINSLINVSKLDKLPLFEDSQYNTIVESIYNLSEELINSNEIRTYFNLKKKDIKVQSKYEIQRNILDKVQLLKLLIEISKINEEKEVELNQIQQLKDILINVQSNDSGLSNGSDYLILLSEIQIHQFSNEYGLALKKVIEYSEKKLIYSSKNKQKLGYLLDLQTSLIKKLKYDSVWKSFISNKKLIQFPDIKNEIYG
ncbi:subtilisin-like protein [Neoconidiobolus thromboides FSU 785]|nr:subtilisin-like protein [Neoconidiobolus thromboides FSU 785]